MTAERNLSRLDRISLTKTIRVLIQKGDAAADKAEQFYKAAGLHLKQLKADKPANETWEDYVERYVKKHCGIGIRRAQELIAIADGRTTLEKVRATKAESMRRLRQAHHSGAPFDPQAIAERMAEHLPPMAARWLKEHPSKTLADYVVAITPRGDPDAAAAAFAEAQAGRTRSRGDGYGAADPGRPDRLPTENSAPKWTTSVLTSTRRLLRHSPNNTGRSLRSHRTLPCASPGISAIGSR